MTFDDGVLKIFRTENASGKGEMPVERNVFLSEHYFCWDILGYSRYYTALQANQNISAVVNIPEWHDISPLCRVEMEDERQYLIRMVQPMTDENGLHITKLTLERIGDPHL